MLTNHAIPRHPAPCAIVIFGASGDLTKRKLVPALYTLYSEKILPDSWAILGMARRDIDFVKEMKIGVEQFARHKNVDHWDEFSKRLSYFPGEFDDPQAYQTLKEKLDQLDQTFGTKGNRLFYIATPPEFFATIVQNLGQHGMISKTEDPFTRVIIEKPFGHNLESAQALNQVCLQVLQENQIYRIDHYLGKETVQNILVFRFANGIFEPLWNRNYIDHVQITVAESIGIEGRGGYYDKTGALRDMVQNHLFQLLSLTALEPPVAFSADAVRNEKVKVYQALREIPLEQLSQFMVRAQYAAGPQSVAYRQESDVNPNSQTETYVALKLFIDNWRWGGVPFYIRSGKKLPKRVSEIAIVFRSVPHALFSGVLPKGQHKHEPNVLSLRIQPDEGITLKFISKVPGPSLDPEPVTMDFRYGTSFGVEPPEAYERLLLDALLGDSTLFTRGDEVLASWRFCERILQAWQQQGMDTPSLTIPTYESGSWGPKESDELLAKEGRSWRQP